MSNKLDESTVKFFKCWCNAWLHDTFLREVERNKKQKTIDVIR